ncbi:MAG TPA: protein kinase [Vicinamibacterales bacterium]|nr:protein kinase [Vicinamibacterales bacterium]
MPLGPGTRLGPYEIVSAIGAGGMGEVYKAKDTRLDRIVAIKVLPSHVSDDPALRERFEREARAVAALNHPHICTLHDVGRHEATDYLVLEYLEGPTLADRLAKGALPLDQALAIAIQLADALDKAHRAGIVHRDLKPGNIMLTKAGAKLLDFGLAKIAPAIVTASGASFMPTAHAPVTARGMILGTLQYMAPEQLEGKESDARTDIFAFGTVLYEMLTGRKAFEGRSEASLIAAILEHEPPPVTTLQPLMPASLDRIVTTCLAKDPDDRWQTFRDLLRELRWVALGGGETKPLSVPAQAFGRLAWFALAAIAIVGAAATPVAVLHLRELTAEPRAIRFSLATPAAGGSPNHLALSPDGRALAFAGYDDRGTQLLWVRSLDALTSRPLSGTEGAQSPFWSADNRVIGFYQGGRLKRISATGGAAQTLCELPAGTQGALGAEGATWSRDGVILFASAGSLYRVPSAGGTPTLVRKPEATRQERFRDPHFLPDNRHFLFLNISQGQQERTGIYVASLDSSSSSLLVSSLTKAEYAPSGHLLFVREGTLMALAFDQRRLQVAGEPFVVAEHVSSGNLAGFSVSRESVLAYRERNDSVEADSRLLWFDRTGREAGSIGEPGLYRDPALSPDGKRIAVARRDPRLNTDDVWVFDAARGTGSRMTFDAGSEWQPLWSPDGSRLAFVSGASITQAGPNATTNVLWKSMASLSPDQLLYTSPSSTLRLDDWSRDNRFVLVSQRLTNRQSLLMVPFGAEAKPQPVFSGRYAIPEARLSPDGRWIAYTSDESGKAEVYVQPFPSGGKRQISADGGSQPVWRGDGRELFYLAEDSAMMSVSITVGPAFEASKPQVLFQARIGGLFGVRHYTVSSDGQRFLVVTQIQQQPVQPINVMVDWLQSVTK